jgi:hypothetical protein
VARKKKGVVVSFRNPASNHLFLAQLSKGGGEVIDIFDFTVKKEGMCIEANQESVWKS